MTEINTTEKAGKWTSEVHCFNDAGRRLFGAMITGQSFAEVTAEIEKFLKGRVNDAKQ